MSAHPLSWGMLWSQHPEVSLTSEPGHLVRWATPHPQPPSHLISSHLVLWRIQYLGARRVLPHHIHRCDRNGQRLDERCTWISQRELENKIYQTEYLYENSLREIIRLRTAARA